MHKSHDVETEFIMHDTPTPSLENLLPVMPERPPFAGFLPRFGAFFIDMLLLYGVAYFFDRTARAALLEMNPALPWIGHGVALAYFWLSQGSLGKGHTAGKAILGLQVVDAQGKPLGWGRAFCHALPQQAAFLVLINTDLYAGIFPPTWRFAAANGLTLLSITCLTFIITTAVGIAIHPRKRGWHDTWAGDYVTRDPLPGNFLSTLASPLDLLSERRMAFYSRITLLFWVLATTLLIIRPLQRLSQPEVRWRAKEIARIEAAHPVAPYYIAQVQFPNLKHIEGFTKTVQYQRETARQKNESVPTTETLRKQMIIDGVTNMVQLLRRQGAFTPEDLKRPEFRTAMDGLRTQLWRAWEDRRKQAAGTPTLPKAQGFVALLYEANPLLFEPFAILFQNNATQLRGIVRGPANPADGPLEFEEFKPPKEPSTKSPILPEANSPSNDAVTTKPL